MQPTLRDFPLMARSLVFSLMTGILLISLGCGDSMSSQEQTQKEQDVKAYKDQMREMKTAKGAGGQPGKR